MLPCLRWNRNGRVWQQFGHGSANGLVAENGICLLCCAFLCILVTKRCVVCCTGPPPPQNGLQCQGHVLCKVTHKQGPCPNNTRCWGSILKWLQDMGLGLSESLKVAPSPHIKLCKCYTPPRSIFYVYVVIRVIFFFAVNARNKKTVRSCIFFFRCKSCKPAYTTYCKKTKITRPDGFFVTRIYSGKKNYTTYSKKKITRPDGFFVTRIYSEKQNYTTYRKKKITRCDDFFLQAFTTKIQKLHDLTTKEELPILLKMPACRQCAHLWATSDSAPRSEAVGTPEAAGVM